MKACDFCGEPCSGVAVTVVVRSVVPGESALSRAYAKTACRPECAENAVDLGLRADVLIGRRALETQRARELAALKSSDRTVDGAVACLLLRGHPQIDAAERLLLETAARTIRSLAETEEGACVVYALDGERQPVPSSGRGTDA